MNKTSLLRSKKLWIIAAIPLLTVIYFFDNIKGQYRFMQYCKNEGGLRIHEPLKKGVGWQARDYNDAKTAAQLRHVGFVRFLDIKGDGKEYDLQYLGGNPQREESFIKNYSEKEISTIYRWHHINEKITNELRLYRSGYEVIDASTKKILVRYYSFGYSQFNQEKTVLNAPSMTSCHGNKGRDFYDSASWIDKINTAFY